MSGCHRLEFGAPPTSPPNQLVCGDNLEGLAKIEDQMVDFIYVDPPFATGQTRRGRDTAYDDKISDPAQLIAWLAPRLEHCRRILGPTGSLFVHLDHHAVHYAKVHLDGLFGRRRFVNELIWCYSVGGKSRRSFARKHDTILWYSKTREYAFYPDNVRIPRKPQSHMRVVTDSDGHQYQEKTDRKTGRVYRYRVDLGKIPEDWWPDIETLNRGDRERTGWPTQKPERLLNRLISATTREGDSIVDPFCGSGTTVAVAQRHHRRFTAMDANPDAIRITAERLRVLGVIQANGDVAPPNINIRGLAAPTDVDNQRGSMRNSS